MIEMWQFFYQVSQQLGLDLVLYANAAGAGEHWDVPPQAIALDMRQRPSTEQLYAAMCTGSRIPLDEVKKHLHGKIWDELDHTVAPRDSDCEAYLELADSTMLAELAVVYGKRGDRPQPSAEFPMLLTARRTNELLNSIGRSNPRLGGRKPYNPAFINPADLTRFGIEDGDRIRIRSKYGEITGIAEAEDKLRPGTVSMSHCFGLNPNEDSLPQREGACTGRLMTAGEDLDPIFGQPRMSALPVAISRPEWVEFIRPVDMM